MSERLVSPMPLTVSTDSAAYCASVPTRFRSRVSSRSSMPQTAMVAAVTKVIQPLNLKPGISKTLSCNAANPSALPR